MADEIGASKQTVIATIKSLIADGLLREHGQRPCANGYTVEYAMDVAALRALPLVKSHCDDQSENLTGQASIPVKHANPTGQTPLPHQSERLTPPVKFSDPNPPRTSLEPSMNHPSDASHPQETCQAASDVLGTAFRVYCDFGAGVVDYRGAFRDTTA